MDCSKLQISRVLKADVTFDWSKSLSFLGLHLIIQYHIYLICSSHNVTMYHLFKHSGVNDVSGID